MSNFSDDDDLDNLPPDPEDQQDDAPFDEVDLGPTPLSDSSASEPPTLARRILRVAAGLLVLGFAYGLYTGQMPKTFDVEKAAMARALRSGHIVDGDPLPNGYTTIATLAELGELILEKPGGLLSNDWNPVSRITDNMRHWEKGAMVQIRIMVQGLRFNLTRIGPQSVEHPELAAADPLFNFKETSLLVPASEKQYKDATKQLNQYLRRMSAKGASPGEFFAPRQDQVIKFLDRQIGILGSYTSLLQQNVRIPTHNANILNSTDPVTSNAQVNSMWKRDDVFYEVRGGVFVTYHMMLALRRDAERLFNNADALGIMNRILNELESANQPMISPVVLNGNEYGLLANHSLVLASHIARAHLAMRELQQQLSGGGGP